VRFIRQKIILTTLFASFLATASLPAAAFDPMGMIVNEVMNFLIREANKPKKPEYDFPVSNRNIPLNSKAGTLEQITAGNQLEIDGDEYTLAFNSRIRDEGNRIVHTGMIQQEKRIRFTLNNQQQVDKIWLLAPNEK
jgi:hypothetical protein